MRALAWAAAAALAACADVTVQTQYGPVVGTVSGNVTTFTKIPFASPPVGDLRFAAPRPPSPWSSPFNATTDLPTPCAQLKVTGNDFIGVEDCLYLTLYIPSGVPFSSDMPVLFWIYGGGYFAGDSTEFGLYDGAALATKTGAVVVTSNYRLGPFGFMALSALQSEDPNHSTGNAALQDQTFALSWVHNNIGFFGGDASRVAIFGESAGGFSVCWHMVSESSAGLFSAAIMESGSCDSPQFFQPLQEAVAFNTLYSEAMGCNSSDSSTMLACLRALNTTQLLTTASSFTNPNWPFNSTLTNRAPFAEFLGQAGIQVPSTPLQLPALAPLMPWGPAIDGTSVGLQDLPLNIIRAGKANKVPIILGTNANEGSIFIPLFTWLGVVPNSTFPPTDADLPKFFTKCLDMYPPAAVANVTAAVSKQYPPYPNNNNWARGADMLNHLFFACATRRAARSFAQYQPTYLYQFSHKFSFEFGLEYDLLGDYHFSEVYFVWRNQWPAVLHTFDANDWTVSDALSAYWGNMAATGSPNVGPLTAPLSWPRYNETSDLNIQIQVPLNTTQHLLKSMCDFWDGIYTELNG